MNTFPAFRPENIFIYLFFVSFPSKKNYYKFMDLQEHTHCTVVPFFTLKNSTAGSVFFINIFVSHYT